MSSPPKTTFLDPSLQNGNNFNDSVSRDIGMPLASIDENTKPGVSNRPTPGDEIPSSAIFVKNIETTISEEELREVFLPFMTIPDREKLLIAAHFDRGFAFVDLGSKEAVARAVSHSRSSPGIVVGVDSFAQRVVVEPSKKPVRPSGVRAIQEERTRTAKKGKRMDKHDFGKVLKAIDDVLAKGLGGLGMGGSMGGSYSNGNQCY